MKISAKKSVPVSQDMYGLFFEDINYSLDGGLHAEMLENRNFEAVFASGKRDDYTVTYDGRYAWSVYEDDGNGSAFYMDGREPLNNVNPHYMVFEGKGETPSFTNKAYDGIYLKKDETYKVSFYAKLIHISKKSAAPNTANVQAEEQAENCMTDSEGLAGSGQECMGVTISVRKYGKVIAEAKLKISGKEWKKYTCILTAGEDTKQADFVVSLDGEGNAAFDQFSMMPENAVLGVFRKDLAEKLKALSPAFMRFPGGCIVEGNTLANRYKWKDTIAPVEERRFNWNRWAVHANIEETGFSGTFPNYGQTYGVGYYEYFLLCEYLGAKPLPVMNVGLACQFMSSEKVDIEGTKMQEYIQDALDLIEFANGGEDTEWGRKRAEMGHPEPFGLEYLGIGNEQWQTDEINFYGRYEMFEKAIHKKYPQMKLIGSSGPDVWGGGYFRAWDWAREAAGENDNFVYAIDEHYYVSPEWLYDNVHFYDNYDRKIKVFAGEYACHIPGYAGRFNCPDANTLEGAIAEAAFMTGLERNADVVTLASYAPLFARMGYTQWSPNLIWFDGEKSYETPSYYVQQLYSQYHGVSTLSVDMGYGDMSIQENREKEKEQALYASAVKDEQGKIILKIVNGKAEDREVTVEFEDGMAADGMGYTVKYISGEKEDKNTISQTDKVAVKEEKGVISGGTLKVKKNSFMVFVFDK